MDEVHRRVVRRIRELARERGMPLSHVPDRAGVARSLFWAILGGERSPTLRWLGQVAHVLEVDVADLLVVKRGHPDPRP